MRAPAARWRALSGVILGTRISEAERNKGRRGCPRRPVCPFYLRDCGDVLACRRCPFGGLRQPRRNRSPDRVCPCTQPFCLSGFGFTPSAAPRDPALSPACGGSLPYFFNDRTYATSALMSASLTAVFGGIGTGPHTPEPP